MRLVCPNCGAQYEVPAEAIPAAGRDVQCSACGHTWFVGGAGGEAADGGPAAAPEAEPGDADLAWAEPEGVPRVEEDDEERDDLAALAWDPEPAPEDAPPEDVRAAEHGTGDWPEAGEPPAAPRPVRSTVTPEIAEILREEAEREARARAEEARRIEAAAPPAEPEPPVRDEPEEAPAWVPAAPAAAREPEPAPEPAAEPWWNTDPEPPRAAEPDWDVAPAAPSPAAPLAAASPLADPVAPDRDRQRAEEARRRMARLRGEAATAAAPPARRDRLPDIEEIDSSLRGGPKAGAPGAAPAAGRGFRLGFGGVLLGAALLALLYAYAGRITEAAPALAPVLDPYARAIDSGRLWLDARMRGLVEDLGGTNATPPASTAPASEAPEVQAEPPAAPSPAPSDASGG